MTQPSAPDSLHQLLGLLESGSAGHALQVVLNELGANEQSAALAARLAERTARDTRTRELLSVLYDTAGDLAVLGDVEAVLLAIVQRTRAVTGADMAYVSLNDHESGLTWIRKSDGVRTEAYRNIRMPLGTGVLGKAATGLATVRTADYCADPTFVHLSDIDEIVAGEGVQSILGVPMNVQGRVTGALLVADRSPVHYSDDVVEMVDAIARQAAVAIDYTARLTRVTETVRALDAEQVEGRRTVRALEEVLDFDRRLVAALGKNDGDEVIRGLLEDVFGTRVDIIGAGGAPRDPHLDGALQASAAAQSPTFAPLPSGEATIAAAKVGDDLLASLVVRTRVPPDQWVLLEHAALYLGIALQLANVRREAEMRDQHNLIEDFISQRSVPRSILEARLGRLGLDPRAPLAVILIDAPTAQGHTEDLVRQHLREPTLVARHDDHLCILAQASPHDGLHQLLAKPCGADHVGFAQVRGGVDGVPTAHRYAELALTTARTLAIGTVDGETIGALGALLEAEAAGMLPRKLTAPAEPLAEYDRAKGTELVRTAWAVLEFGPKLPIVAQRLFIHLNTLRQRMARIATLLGDDWQSGPRRLDLHLALRAIILQQSSSGRAR